jgi:hypothetical protein
MKFNLKIFFKKLLVVLVYSIIIFGAGSLIGLLIANRLHTSLQETLGMEAILFVVIGIMLSMKGNPFTSIRGMGEQSVNAITMGQLETASTENRITEYNKNFLKHHISEFHVLNLGLIVGGVFIGILSYLV